MPVPEPERPFPCVTITPAARALMRLPKSGTDDRSSSCDTLMDDTEFPIERCCSPTTVPVMTTSLSFTVDSVIRMRMSVVPTGTVCVNG